MKHIKQLLLIGFVGLGLLIVIISFFSQSFTLTGAEQLREDAIELCIGGSGTIESIENCSENHSIERYQIGPLQWAAIVLFVVCPAIAVIFTIFIASWNPFSEKHLSKEQQSKLPKSQDGTLTIGPGRAQLDPKSLFKNSWDIHPVKGLVLNIKDIIKRNHIAKGDYRDYFIELVESYLSPRTFKEYGSADSMVSKEEIIGYLEWAIDTVPKFYAGSEKEIETGKRKIKTLEKNIERMKKS